MQNFPVLAYHKISPQSEFGLTTVKPDIFEQQINLMLDAGFTPVTFRSLLSGAAEAEKPLVLTFDDGYESVYTYVLPLLKKYRIKAVVYILANYIGQFSKWEAFAVQRKFRHLNSEQVRELAAEDIEIGSHGMDHIYYPGYKDELLYRDLVESKALLGDLIGSDVAGFCFPYGRHNNKTRNLVRKAGYRYSVGNFSLFNNNKRNLEDSFFFRRSIYSSDSEYIFKQKLQVPARIDNAYLTEHTIKMGALAGILRHKILNHRFRF